MVDAGSVDYTQRGRYGQGQVTKEPQPPLTNMGVRQRGLKRCSGWSSTAGVLKAACSTWMTVARVKTLTPWFWKGMYSRAIRAPVRQNCAVCPAETIATTAERLHGVSSSPILGWL